jgi:hypothetical protein
VYARSKAAHRVAPALLALSVCTPPPPPAPPPPPPTPAARADEDSGARAASPATTADAVPEAAAPPAPASPLTILAATPGNAGTLAIDDAWAYFIDEVHGVARISKRDGGAVTSIAATHGNPVAFGALALDTTDVYWTVDTAPPRGIWRVHKDGHATPADATPFLATGQSAVGCLAVDADSVYWMQVKGESWAAGGSIRRSGKDGRAAPVIATFDTPGFGCLAVDDARLYWLEYSEHREGGGRVRAAPRKGGSPRNLAHVVAPPVFLKADRDSLYWAEGPSIMRAPLDGRPAAPLLALPKACLSVGEMALDDAFLYFTCGGFGPRQDSGTVWRVAKTGGAPVQLADGQTHPAAIAVDADFVYWVFVGTQAASYRDGGLARLVKPPPPGP